eukprot:13329796-Heterocapsa_arctica.AAC.1
MARDQKACWATSRSTVMVPEALMALTASRPELGWTVLASYQAGDLHSIAHASHPLNSMTARMVGRRWGSTGSKHNISWLVPSTADSLAGHASTALSPMGPKAKCHGPA